MSLPAGRDLLIRRHSSRAQQLRIHIIVQRLDNRLFYKRLFTPRAQLVHTGGRKKQPPAARASEPARWLEYNIPGRSECVSGRLWNTCYVIYSVHSVDFWMNVPAFITVSPIA